MEFDDIRLLDKEADLSKIKPYDWDLVVNGKPYYVCNIPGYAHSISYTGGLECRRTLWCYPRDKKPSLDNLIEYTLKEPVSWGIEYSCNHKVKCKWDEVETVSGGHAVITRNGEPFYTVGGDRTYATTKALYLINRINEHPLGFNDIDFDKKMVGRKIWYRSEPGIITYYVHGQCCVLVVPEGFDRFKTPPEFEHDDWMQYEDREVKLDCLEDGNIWWFRD